MRSLSHGFKPHDETSAKLMAMVERAVEAERGKLAQLMEILQANGMSSAAIEVFAEASELYAASACNHTCAAFARMYEAGKINV